MMAGIKGQAQGYIKPESRPTKVWIERIDYEILGNLGADPSLNTYTNQPPKRGVDGCDAR